MGQYIDIQKIIQAIYDVSGQVVTGGTADGGVTANLHGWVDGGSFQPVKVDRWHRSILVMPYDQHITYQGYSFTTSASTILGINGKVGIMIKTNSVRPSAIARADLSLAGVFKSWVNPPGIVYKPGNILPATNRNFAMQNTIVSGISICTNPGTPPTTGHARKIYIGADTKKLNSGGASDNLPYILDDNDIYYLEIESFAADNAVSFNIDWNEQTPYGGSYPDGT